MAVQPQTPYKEYTANGSTKSFALEFDCDNQDHLIVLVDDVEAIVGTWSLSNGAVVFGNAPATGKKITVQRNTPFRRDGDFQSYDNSFRPGPVNKGFDWIWLKLQELGVADWILSNRINDLRAYVDKQDIVLQDNIDSLKNYVDDKDDELRNYLLNAIQEQGVALDQLEEYYSYLMQQLAQVAIDRGWAASFIVSADGSTQQEINDFGGAKWWDKPLGYGIGATVKLDNGDIVKSTMDGNTNNPNSDMSGWVYAELEFYVQHAGAKADFNPSTETGTDNLQAFKDARDQAIVCGIKTVRIPSGNYLVNLTELSGIVVNETQDIRFVGDGKESTTIWVDSTAEENVLFNMVGGSAYNTNRGLTGATVRAIPSNKYKGIAYRKNGACFTLLEDFIFQDMFVGDDTVNGIGAGTFCEFNITQNGRLNTNKINRRYLVDGGDNSFHGNNVINVQNQVKTGGGIGVQVRGSSTTPAYLYNQAWIENYFGGAGCIALSLDNMNSDNLWGNLTHEDTLIIETKSDYCNFQFKGDFSGIGSITYSIFNENSKGFGVVVFNNTNSLTGNFTDTNLSGYAPSLFQLGQQDRYANGVTNTIYSIGEGLGFNCYWTSVGWMFTRNGGSGDIKSVTPSFNISANGQTLKSFNSSYNIVNMNNNGLQVFDDRIQGVVAGMDLGRFDSRFNRLYLNKLDINGDAFVPNIPATYSIGYSSNYVKDIFSLNAVTVVSDVRHKTEVSELTEQELQCAIACGKLYRKYKLNAAVDEKGVNSARYHIGVIAQEAVQCFTDHNLDWRKYGIITYEKWDAIEAIEYQAATYDENGELLTPEIQAIEAREAGEIYMVRYDELNCFINAGLEYRLSRLE